MACNRLELREVREQELGEQLQKMEPFGLRRPIVGFNADRTATGTRIVRPFPTRVCLFRSTGSIPSRRILSWSRLAARGATFFSIWRWPFKNTFARSRHPVAPGRPGTSEAWKVRSQLSSLVGYISDGRAGASLRRSPQKPPDSRSAIGQSNVQTMHARGVAGL